MVNFRCPPYPYQRAVFEAIKDAPYKALFLEQGLGKTKIMCDVLSHLYSKKAVQTVVVISHASVAANWYYNELPKHLWYPESAQLFLWQSDKGKRNDQELENFVKKKTTDLKIICINKEALRLKRAVEPLQRLSILSATAVVIDESTIIKNADSKTTEIIRLYGQLCKYRYILTGTPEVNSPEDYFGQLSFLDQQILGVQKLTHFRNKYCVTEDVWVGRPFPVKKTIDFRDRDAFMASLEPYAVRLRKEDVLKDLPEKVYTVRKVPLSKPEKDAYLTMKNQAVARLTTEAGDSGFVTADSVLKELVTLQTITSGFIRTDEDSVLWQENPAKLEALRDILEDGIQTTVWCRFRATVEKLRSEFPGAAWLYGGMSDAERQEQLRRFKDGEAQILVANPATAGWGLTLTHCWRSVYYENSYNYEHRAQSEDRFHRIGQKNNVHYIDLEAVCDGEPTVDAVIKLALDRKSSVQGMIPLDEFLAAL